MDITSVITITELSRLTKRSRPTIYKYFEDYQKGNYKDIPEVVLELLKNIDNNKFSKKDIYEYCEKWFNCENNTQVDKELYELFELIKNNKEKINIRKLIDEIRREIN